MAKRGVPKGAPKSGGRKPGTPNRASAEEKLNISTLAKQHTKLALSVLVSVAQSGETETARVSAAAMHASINLQLRLNP